MKKRFLIIGCLIASLSLSGCSNVGEKNKNTAQTQSNVQKSVDETVVDAVGIKFKIPKAWKEIGVEPSVLDNKKVSFSFICTEDMKEIAELSQKIQEKKMENKGKKNKEDEDKLMKLYMKKIKNLGYIIKVNKDEVKKVLKSEDYKVFSKKDKVGEINDYEYYFVYNEKIDDSNLSEASKNEIKEIIDGINEFKSSIKVIDPKEEQHNKKEEKATEEKIDGNIEFKSKTIQGKNIDNTIFKDNKLTMINIWATDCGPCIDEMPDLQKLYEEVKSKNVNVVGIIADTPDEDNEALANSIIEKQGVKFENIIPDKNLNEWIRKNVKGTPTTIFVDKDGKIISSALVGSTNKSDYKIKIDEVLKSVK